MPDSNTTSPSTTPDTFSASEATLDDVRQWGQDFVESGNLDASKWRRASSALDQLTSVLTESESRDVASIMEALPSLAQRWIVKGNNNARTGETYRYRASKALQEFVVFKRDGKMPAPGGERRSTSSDAGNGRSGRRSSRASGSGSDPHRASGNPMRTFPLANGHEVQFCLPEEGIETSDVNRFAYHLLTLAKDFDPAVVFSQNAQAVPPTLGPES